MPKLKTHSGTKKRIYTTKTGKVARRHASGNHFLQKKRASRKRTFTGIEIVKGSQSRSLKRMLGKG